MYEATVIINNEAATISAPTIETMYSIIFFLNANVYVKGTLVKAAFSTAPDGTLFAGYTVGGLRALYERA